MRSQNIAIPIDTARCSGLTDSGAQRFGNNVDFGTACHEQSRKLDREAPEVFGCKLDPPAKVQKIVLDTEEVVPMLWNLGGLYYHADPEVPSYF